MIKVGIIGATGYAGQELVRLITQHPQAEIVHLLLKVMQVRIMRKFIQTIDI